MVWTVGRIFLGLLGIWIAFTYDPLEQQSIYNTSIFVILLLGWGIIPHILGVWRMLDTEVQPKATKLKQFLLHVILFGIQLFMVVYFVFLSGELSLSPLAVQILILSATLAYAVQALLVDRAVKRLSITKKT